MVGLSSVQSALGAHRRFAAAATRAVIWDASVAVRTRCRGIDVQRQGERRMRDNRSLDDIAESLFHARNQAVDDVLCKCPAEPERRSAPEGNPHLDFTQLECKLRSTATSWASASHRDLYIEKTGVGTRRNSVHHENALLCELDHKQIRSVTRWINTRPILDGTEDALAIQMEHHGLDFLKWNLLCHSPTNNPKEDPFCNAEFYLALVCCTLEKLADLHRAGYVHCDLKLDNICARALARTRLEENNLIGHIDLRSLTLIDLGLSLGPVQERNGWFDRKGPNGYAVNPTRRPGPGDAAPGEAIDIEWIHYLSPFYIAAYQGKPDGESGHKLTTADIHAGVDLYSIACWLHQLIYRYDANSAGLGPWPKAELRKEIHGSEQQLALLRDLPQLLLENAEKCRLPRKNLVDASGNFSPDNLLNLLPHWNLKAKIDPWTNKFTWTFVTPLQVSGAALLQCRERAFCGVMTAFHANELIPMPDHIQDILEEDEDDDAPQEPLLPAQDALATTVPRVAVATPTDYIPLQQNEANAIEQAALQRHKNAAAEQEAQRQREQLERQAELERKQREELERLRREQQELARQKTQAKEEEKRRLREEKEALAAAIKLEQEEANRRLREALEHQQNERNAEAKRQAEKEKQQRKADLDLIEIARSNPDNPAGWQTYLDRCHLHEHAAEARGALNKITRTAEQETQRKREQLERQAEEARKQREEKERLRREEQERARQQNQAKEAEKQRLRKEKENAAAAAAAEAERKNTKEKSNPQSNTGESATGKLIPYVLGLALTVGIVYMVATNKSNDVPEANAVQPSAAAEAAPAADVAVVAAAEPAADAKPLQPAQLAKKYASEIQALDYTARELMQGSTWILQLPDGEPSELQNKLSTALANLYQKNIPGARLWVVAFSCDQLTKGNPHGFDITVKSQKQCGSEMAKALQSGQAWQAQNLYPGGNWKEAVFSTKGAVIPVLWQQLIETPAKSSPKDLQELATTVEPGLLAYQGKSAPMDWLIASIHACWAPAAKRSGWLKLAKQDLTGIARKYKGILFGVKAEKSAETPEAICEKGYLTK